MSEERLTPEEVAQQFLQAEGKQMFDTTGGDTYRSGQMLANDPRRSAEEQTKPGETTSPETSTTKPAEDKLLFGKWKNQEEAERGVHELIQYASQAVSERDALKTKIDALGAAMSVLNGGAQAAPAELDPLEELEKSWALPREPLEKAIDRQVEKRIQNWIKPAVEREKANKEVVKEFPGYVEQFDDMMEFLEKNPEIKQRVQYAEDQGQYRLAREYAWLNFDRSRKTQAQPGVEAKAKNREEKVAETLPDAGFSAGTRNDGRTPPTIADWPTGDRMKYLREMASAGHPDLLWRETLGRILTEQGFDKTG